MGRFLGTLSTDAYKVTVGEAKVAHLHIPAEQVLASDTDAYLDGTPFPDTAGTETDILSQPPYPMNVVAVASGTQTGTIKVYGLDIGGFPITEDIVLTSATPKAGVKAFSRIDKVDLPAKVGSETIDLGWGTKFGIPYKMSTNALLLTKLFNGATDNGTMTANATELSKNVFALNGTADGKKPIDLYFIV